MRWQVGPLAALLTVTCLIALSTSSDFGITGWTSKLFSSLGPSRLSISDLLLLAWALLLLFRHRASREANPWFMTKSALAWLSVALALAAAQGIALGAMNHEPGVFVDAKGAIYLVAVPWLVVASVRSHHDFRAVARTLLWLSLAQSTLGIVNVLLGVGQVAGNAVLSFADGGPVFVIVFGLFQAGISVVRGNRDRLAWTVLPVGVLALLLSQRRSFLLAAALVAVLLLLVSVTDKAALRVLLAGVVLAFAVALSATGHLPTIISTGRGASISQVHTPLGDLYRAAERTNVWANIKLSPIGGLGFGVPWRQFDPLPGYFAGYSLYTHVGYLWYWLKMGVIGLGAYVGLLALAIWSGLAAIKRVNADLRAIILAAVGMVGVDIIVEGTATFSGADVQYSYLLSLAIGLAVAARLLAGRTVGENKVLDATPVALGTHPVLGRWDSNPQPLD